MGVAAFGTKINKYFAELTNISGPGTSRNMIDVSSHDSPDEWREFVAGMIDGGTFSLEGNVTSGTVATMLAALGEDSEEFIITLADDFTWTFNAFMSSLSFGAPHEDKLSFSASLKVTGTPTLAAK
jgi:predicted secreted protein